MKSICLKFYIYELQKYEGLPLYEWLLEEAKKRGVQGGFATRAIAGFGRHGVMHEESFFELASNVPVEVQFFVTKNQVTELLEMIKKEKLNLAYSTSDIEFSNIKEYSRLH